MKRKQSFILLEVLIAFLLVATVGVAYFQVEAAYARKIEEAWMRADLMRIRSAALAHCYLKLLSEVSWDSLENPTEAVDIYDEGPWHATAKFSIVKADKPTPHNVYSMVAVLTITHDHIKGLSEQITFPFCASRKGEGSSDEHATEEKVDAGSLQESSRDEA